MKDNISITNNKYLLWNVITFQAWFDNFKKIKLKIMRSIFVKNFSIFLD